MTFPDEPRPMLFELQVGATDWANITPYVFSQRQQIDIDWGVPSEYALADPTVLTFQINNANGLFSPRNPLSPLYGQIGRNTPIRCSIGEGAKGMVLGLPDSTESNGRGESVDSAQLSPTGDLDLRVDMEILEDSTRLWSTGNFDLCSKFNDNDADRSYSFHVVGGLPRLSWFTAGTAASVRSVTGGVAIPGTTGRKTLRATLDVDNGSGQSVVTFYTGDSVNGPWTVLGAPTNSAGTSSVFNGGATTRVGAGGGTSAWTWGMAPHATIYEAQLRSGINGTIIASPNWTTQPLDPVPFGLSNFSDAQGNDWTYSGSADAARVWYGDVDIRAHVECSSFPNEWDTSGEDAWVSIEGAGILRRLGRGQEPAVTGLRDWIMSQDPVPTSYFPLAGAEGTKYSVNLGDVGTNSLRFFAEGAPRYTYGKDFGTTYLGTGMELNATGDTTNLRGDVVTTDDNFTLDFVFQSPVVLTEGGTDPNTNVGALKILVWSFDYDRWQLQFQDEANWGRLQLTWFAWDGVGSIVFPGSAVLPALQDNEIHTCRFQIRSTGGGLTQTADVYIDGELVDTRTAATAKDINGTWMYQMFYTRYTGQNVVNLGHLTGWSDPGAPAPPDVTEFHAAAMGYAGELAADRMERIAAIGGIPLTVAGDNADTMPMGPQHSESKISQLRDAEAADMGILMEPRDRFGLEYRTRVSMIGQAPALTLDYAAGHIVPPFKPTDDDQLTKNDFTASRRDGDSYRAQLTSGKLSVLEPPSGVGRYHDGAEYNVETDAMLEGIAHWQVNLGTIDQARYPVLMVDLGILAAAGLDQAARAVKSGDLLVVQNMSALGVYDDVRLLVLGGHETISDGAYRHVIAWNCAPYIGYEGSVYATSGSTGDARYDTNGSALATGVSSSATSLSISATGGTLWTTDPAAFPLDIMMGGERITLSAISGAASPQTATVSARSVNGVVKAHSAGADIRLAEPSYYSL